MLVTAYIAKQAAERIKILSAINAAILKYDKTVQPVVGSMMGKEMIQYKQAGIFKYGLSSVKNHISLHLMPIYADPKLHSTYKELLPLANFQKGCINFVNEKEMPVAVAKDLIKDCAAIDMLAIMQQYKDAKVKKAGTKKKV